MDNVNIDQLRKIHGDKAQRVYEEIRDRGGFGNVSSEYVGGLDVRSVIDPANTSLSTKEKSELAKLAGMDKSDRERIDNQKTSSSAERMNKKS